MLSVKMEEKMNRLFRYMVFLLIFTSSAVLPMEKSQWFLKKFEGCAEIAWVNDNMFAYSDGMIPKITICTIKENGTIQEAKNKLTFNKQRYLVEDLQLNPIGNIIAFAKLDHLSSSGENKIFHFDITNKEIGNEIEGDHQNIKFPITAPHALAFHPDNQHFIAKDNDGNLWVYRYNKKTGKTTKTQKTIKKLGQVYHAGEIRRIQLAGAKFSQPNGKYLILRSVISGGYISSKPKKINIINFKSGQQIRANIDPNPIEVIFDDKNEDSFYICYSNKISYYKIVGNEASPSKKPEEKLEEKAGESVCVDQTIYHTAICNFKRFTALSKITESLYPLYKRKQDLLLIKDKNTKQEQEKKMLLIAEEKPLDEPMNKIHQLVFSKTGKFLAIFNTLSPYSRGLNLSILKNPLWKKQPNLQTKLKTAREKQHFMGKKGSERYTVKIITEYF